MKSSSTYGVAPGRPTHAARSGRSTGRTAPDRHQRQEKKQLPPYDDCISHSENRSMSRQPQHPPRPPAPTTPTRPQQPPARGHAEHSGPNCQRRTSRDRAPHRPPRTQDHPTRRACAQLDNHKPHRQRPDTYPPGGSGHPPCMNDLTHAQRSQQDTTRHHPHHHQCTPPADRTSPATPSLQFF